MSINSTSGVGQTLPPENTPTEQLNADIQKAATYINNPHNWDTTAPNGPFIKMDTSSPESFPFMELTHSLPEKLLPICEYMGNLFMGAHNPGYVKPGFFPSMFAHAICNTYCKSVAIPPTATLSDVTHLIDTQHMLHKFSISDPKTKPTLSDTKYAFDQLLNEIGGEHQFKTIVSNLTNNFPLQLDSKHTTLLSTLGALCDNDFKSLQAFNAWTQNNPGIQDQSNWKQQL